MTLIDRINFQALTAQTLFARSIFQCHCHCSQSFYSANLCTCDMDECAPRGVTWDEFRWLRLKGIKWDGTERNGSFEPIILFLSLGDWIWFRFWQITVAYFSYSQLRKGVALIFINEDMKLIIIQESQGYHNSNQANRWKGYWWRRDA